MSADFQMYPKWMHHPNEQPAVISDDYDRGPALGPYHADPGRPRQFPPVQAQSQDQEEYYASRGYVAGASNKEAAIRARIAPIPQDYRYSEYPKMVNGEMVPDPDAPPPTDNRYPKWVHFTDGRESLLVKTEAEERALRPPPPPSEAESEFWAALTEAEAQPPDDREALLESALAYGIAVDRRWGVARLKAAIAEANHAEVA